MSEKRNLMYFETTSLPCPSLSARACVSQVETSSAMHPQICPWFPTIEAAI